MRLLLDTNIAIHLREGDPQTVARFEKLDISPSISIVTMVELWGGVASASGDIRTRREALTRALINDFEVLPFDGHGSEIYLGIVKRLGFARGLVLDRMIAATALAGGLALATANIADFRDVPDLRIEDWSA